MFEFLWCQLNAFTGYIVRLLERRKKIEIYFIYGQNRKNFTKLSLWFVKIRKNVSQLKSFDLKEKSTLNNMRRAANVCLIDTCLILLHLIPLIYSDIFKDHYKSAFDGYIKNDSFWSEFYIYAFSIIGSFYGVFYTLSVMLDVVITCYILRSYRSAILRLFGKVKHMKFSSNTYVSSVKIFVQRSQAGGV